jgi:hypothetical protein
MATAGAVIASPAAAEAAITAVAVAEAMAATLVAAVATLVAAPLAEATAAADTPKAADMVAVAADMPAAAAVVATAAVAAVATADTARERPSRNQRGIQRSSGEAYQLRRSPFNPPPQTKLPAARLLNCIRVDTTGCTPDVHSASNPKLLQLTASKLLKSTASLKRHTIPGNRAANSINQQSQLL